MARLRGQINLIELIKLISLIIQSTVIGQNCYAHPRPSSSTNIAASYYVPYHHGTLVYGYGHLITLAISTENKRKASVKNDPHLQILNPCSQI